jgi:hypothetical protein
VNLTQLFPVTNFQKKNVLREPIAKIPYNHRSEAFQHSKLCFLSLCLHSSSESFSGVVMSAVAQQQQVQSEMSALCEHSPVGKDKWRRYVIAMVRRLMGLIPGAAENLRGFSHASSPNSGGLFQFAEKFVAKAGRKGESRDLWSLQLSVYSRGATRRSERILQTWSRESFGWSWIRCLCLGPKATNDTLKPRWKDLSRTHKDTTKSARFGVVAAGKPPDLTAKLKEMVESCPNARGAPRRLCGNLVFMIMQSQSMIDYTNATAEYLKLFPPGLVTILGSGSAEIWHLPGFDGQAPRFMEILAKSGHILFILLRNA